MSERDRPRIGITTGGHAAWMDAGARYQPYAEAVRDAGGEPVRLGPENTTRAAELLRDLDGLLLSGGVDVDLRLYPRPPDTGTLSPEELMELRRMQWEPARDHLELPLVLGALERDLPILGICRGCQVMNVALGGQLILDLPSEVPGPVDHAAVPPPDESSSNHLIEVLVGSRLAALLGDPTVHPANSRHHQAVIAGTAEGVVVAAVSPLDGVVEAVELPAARWAVGVQWHPERPQDAGVRERHRPLFDTFVAECRRTR